MFVVWHVPEDLAQIWNKSTYGRHYAHMHGNPVEVQSPTHRENWWQRERHAAYVVAQQYSSSIFLLRAYQKFYSCEFLLLQNCISLKFLQVGECLYDPFGEQYNPPTTSRSLSKEWNEPSLHFFAHDQWNSVCKQTFSLCLLSLFKLWLCKAVCREFASVDIYEAMKQWNDKNNESMWADEQSF